MLWSWDWGNKKTRSLGERNGRCFFLAMWLKAEKIRNILIHIFSLRVYSTPTNSESHFKPCSRPSRQEKDGSGSPTFSSIFTWTSWSAPASWRSRAAWRHGSGPDAASTLPTQFYCGINFVSWSPPHTMEHCNSIKSCFMEQNMCIFLDRLSIDRSI